MSSNEKHLLTGNLYVIHEKTAFLQPLSMGCCRERILDWGAGNSGLSQLSQYLVVPWWQSLHLWSLSVLVWNMTNKTAQSLMSLLDEN